MLTNCTFDGIVYDPARVMEECLAIKPDLVFLWDEAWFAFARFHPVYRRRTAMAAARQLLDRYRSPEYRASYAEYRRHLGAEPADACLLGQRLLPDPDAARIRVYVTQSTHKTLTSLRQGSMIHVFKSTRNTLLFMTTIGTTRSAVSYLIEVLVKLVRDLEEHLAEMSPRERAAHQARVAALTGASAPLPDFSAFHQAFRPGRDTPEGAMRDAFYLAYDDSSCDYLPAEDISALIAAGREPVSATFVTPYPPGFPVLVPGQVISPQVLAYMGALDTREIHGYRPELGYQIFTEAALMAPGPQSAR